MLVSSDIEAVELLAWQAIIHVSLSDCRISGPHASSPSGWTRDSGFGQAAAKNSFFSPTLKQLWVDLWNCSLLKDVKTVLNIHCDSLHGDVVNFDDPASPVTHPHGQNIKRQVCHQLRFIHPLLHFSSHVCFLICPVTYWRIKLILCYMSLVWR